MFNHSLSHREVPVAWRTLECLTLFPKVSVSTTLLDGLQQSNQTQGYWWCHRKNGIPQPIAWPASEVYNVLFFLTSKLHSFLDAMNLVPLLSTAVTVSHHLYCMIRVALTSHIRKINERVILPHWYRKVKGFTEVWLLCEDRKCHHLANSESFLSSGNKQAAN